MTEDRPLSSKKLEKWIGERMLAATLKKAGAEAEGGCERQAFGHAVQVMTLQAVLDAFYAREFDP